MFNNLISKLNTPNKRYFKTLKYQNILQKLSYLKKIIYVHLIRNLYYFLQTNQLF